MAKFLERILGDPNKQAIKKLKPILTLINLLEPSIEPLSDEELKAKTEYFKEQLANGKTLDDILPEAFAVVRETAKRVLGERAFDTQLMGGIVLHQGKISELKTGEGKTLAATLPVYLNALTGKGVHVVTVNDYLAKRDSEWMGKIYEFLGLTVGVITHNTSSEERKLAYEADITYGTNNEFGFDYLRDNMAGRKEDQVQRGLNFAIVDEVDSILVDEARTPLIISAPDEESTQHYKQFAALVPQLQKDTDYTTDDKTKSAILTEAGIEKIQKLLGISDIYESGNILLAHHIEQALRAEAMYKRDVDYVVKEGEVLIVDEFTGRLMPGRRYSEGLHQAIEAKENVEVKRESKTLATITFQNYFRLFDKLGGMTGTAKTEEEEFWKIYGLEVVVIPTNQPMVRADLNDLIYINERAKFQAVVKEIQRRHETGQPVLVGTIAIEKSELLSDMLKVEGVPHNVLNAKHHEREAEIVKDAGQKNMVTIATNMAGRGTDIKLGEGVTELGGLHIIGTERHESRRIDNQLRGRAGRQGDPGSTQFFVSLEDDLMRMFGSERLKSMMKTLKIPEDQPLEHKWITSSIESAQKRVEGHNFDIRKRVVEYDDVMNRHRATIYRQRQIILDESSFAKASDDLRENSGQTKEIVQGYIFEQLRLLAGTYSADLKMLLENVNNIFPIGSSLQKEVEGAGSPEKISELLIEEAKKQYEDKEKEAGGEDNFRQGERAVLLRVMDILWMEHIDAMTKMRESIGLQGYGQRDPLVEYKQEAYAMFQRLQGAIAFDTARLIYKVRIVTQAQQQTQEMEEKKNLALKGAEEPKGDFSDEKKELASEMKNEELRMKNEGSHPSSYAKASEGPRSHKASGDLRAVRDPQERKNKVGRNDPCPCGSGKKFKKCCGK